MRANQTLSTIYALKEQLQALWSTTTETAMRWVLTQWRQLARATTIRCLRTFAATLENHADGICAYVSSDIYFDRSE